LELTGRTGIVLFALAALFITLVLALDTLRGLFWHSWLLIALVQRIRV